MKILHVNKYLHNFGGAEAYMFYLADALKQNGHQVDFWGMNNEKNIVPDNYDSNNEYIDYKTQSLASKISHSLKTVYNNSSRINIIKALEGFNPDIVHLHNYNFQLTPSILPEIKKRNIKIIQTVHDSQMVCPYHRLYNFRLKSTCTKCVTGGFYNCIVDRCFDNSLPASVLGAVESYFYHNNNYYNKYIDHIISPSNFLADLIRNRYNKPISVVPNFFDYKGTLENKSSEKYYLYYGRLVEEKGVLDIIPIFNKEKIKLKIIGTGPIENQLVNSQYIEYLGPIYGDKLFDIVSKAKFVIQPAKGFENCPMTVVEAFSLGVPVIAANHSGFKELINDGETGYLIDFDKKSEKELRYIIRSIDENKNKNYKSSIKKFYNKYLTMDIHIKSILEIYKSNLN